MATVGPQVPSSDTERAMQNDPLRNLFTEFRTAHRIGIGVRFGV